MESCLGSAKQAAREVARAALALHRARLLGLARPDGTAGSGGAAVAVAVAGGGLSGGLSGRGPMTGRKGTDTSACMGMGKGKGKGKGKGMDKEDHLVAVREAIECLRGFGRKHGSISLSSSLVASALARAGHAMSEPPPPGQAVTSSAAIFAALADLDRLR